MSAKLVAEEGVLKGLSFPFLEGEEWTIGRDPDNCELVIEDPDASRLHARCHRVANGLVIENLSQEQPTEVNDKVVDQPRMLQEGDTIKIGSTLFRYHISEKEENPASSEILESKVSPEKGESRMSDAEKSHLGSLASGDDAKDQNEEVEPLNSEGEQDVLESSEQEEKNPPSEAAEELLEEEILERQEEKSPISDEQDDIFPAEEHAIGAEKYSAEGQEPSHNTNTESTNKDVMDTIFQDEASNDNKDLIAEVNFDMLETGRWLLKVVGGPNTGAEFSMQAASNYLIGTDPNTCDIVFHDTSVSRQHARITISDEDTLVLEDLKSRNGTMIDGKKVEGRVALEPNVIVSVGTTSFVVFDREGEMQTIISPMLPSIVKVLQQEENKNEKIEETASVVPPLAPLPTEVTSQLEEKPTSKTTALGAFLLISLVTGLFLVVGIGTLALFRSEPVSIEEPLNINATLKDALSPFKDVKYSYNQPSGRLLLVGHVLNATDKNQLIYNLQGLPFVKTIDDKGIIIDEFVTREINPILARNKAWKGVTIQTPQPGQFVLTGYLQTRDQAEQLSEYINTNFPNLDQLDRRIIVEEEVTSSVETMLQKVGIRDVQIKITSGEVTLTGGIPSGKEAEFNRILQETKSIPGIRNVRSYVSELPAEASLVNISDRYKVSGASNQGGVNLSVVINGRILGRGDILDGMTITSIKPNVIFLEKDGIKYRVDY
ncbi:MAG: type III secretion system inner membrane ring subunit SctD [Parachlamydiales bacterium]|jgi:type III secretion system YscD/HrpQ family protein